MGHVDQHTPATLKATFEKAYVALKLDDGSIYTGSLDQLPAVTHTLPTVLFMHGSSGINPAIREFSEHISKLHWSGPYVVHVGRALFLVDAQIEFNPYCYRIPAQLIIVITERDCFRNTVMQVG